MAEVTFRIVGYPRILTTSSATDFAQTTLLMLNQRSPKTPKKVQIQIGIINPRLRSGFEWCDLGICHGLGQFYLIEMTRLLPERDAIWAAILEADRQLKMQQAMIESLIGWTAKPGPLRIVDPEPK